MKKKLLFTACAWLMCLGHALADEFVINDVTIPQGGTADLTVGFNFTTTTDKVGFTFALGLPEGITLVKDVDGDPVYEKDETSISKLNIAFADNGNGGIAGQPSNENATIKGTSGTLLTLQLTADASLTAGSTHTVNVTKATFQQRVDGSVTDITIPDFTFTVTISEPADSRIVLDETSTTAPEAATGVDVCVKRTINANEWSTICLPFAMTAEQIQTAFGDDVTVELADAVSYETTEDDDDKIVGITINFNNVSPLAIEANHPYIIKVDKKITSFDVDGVNVNPATSVSGRRKKIGTGSYFIGNYENQTEVPEFSLFLNGNKFWYSTGLTKMKAFRAYFTLRDVLTEVDEAAARISFSFDEATGISDNNRETITNNRYYDLQGRSVEKPAKKGLYIRNGKKEIVK